MNIRKRFKFIVLLSCLLIGCASRHPFPDQVSEGRMFQLGQNTLVTTRSSPTADLQGLPASDMAMLIADSLKTKLEARGVPTGPSYPYSSENWANPESKKHRDMLGLPVALEINLSHHKSDPRNLLLNGGSLFVEGKKRKLNVFTYHWFTFKGSYQDPESRYRGFQAEISSILDQLLDEFFEAVHKDYPVEP